MRCQEASATFDPREFAMRRALEDSHWWHLHRRELLRREIARLVPPSRAVRLADLGCGIGTVAIHLAAAGWSVDAVDLFEEALAIGRARADARLGAAAHAVRFLQGDVTAELPVHDADGVLLLDVIEHLPDDVGALVRARRALRPGPGGFVLVTVPAFPLLWSPWDELERHQRRYTPASLDATLRRAGLAPVRTTCFFGPVFVAALAVKIARRSRDTLRRTVGLPPSRPRDILDTTEAVDHPLLNRLALGALAPERELLGRGSLPLGTSLLAVARPETGA